MPGGPHHLMECVWECVMELLMTFTDAKVFSNVEPLNWVRITPARMTEPAESVKSQEWSHSHTRRGRTQGSFVAAHNMERSTPTATTPEKGLLATASPRIETQPECTSIRSWTPPPGCVDIAISLWGEDSLHTTIEIPLELTTPQGLLVGTTMATMTSTQLQQDVAKGTTYLDMITTSMSLVSLGLPPWQLTNQCLHWRDGKIQSLTKLPQPELLFLLVVTHPEPILNSHSHPTCVYVKHSLSYRFVSCYTNGDILFSNL